MSVNATNISVVVYILAVPFKKTKGDAFYLSSVGGF